MITSYHNQHDFCSHYQQTGEIVFCWLPQALGRWLIYQSHVDTPIVERSKIYRIFLHKNVSSFDHTDYLSTQSCVAG